MSADPRVILLIGYAGAQSLDLIGPLEVFSMANRIGRRRVYETILASVDGGDIVCNSGVRLADAMKLGDAPQSIDTLLVAGGDDAALSHAVASVLPSMVSARVSSTRRIGSVCTGAFVLAAAGLLDGRRATTHWDSCAEMREFRPSVALEPDAIYVADPPFYTSAGVTAGIDLCLSFVEADCGHALALAVARNLVLFMRRPGGQSQFSPALSVHLEAAPRLSKLIAEIRADPHAGLRIPDLAEAVAMSTRTFSRLFKRETGVTPAEFLDLARLDRAKALLEASDWPLARLAERSGFGNVSGLHRSFQKRLGVTPGDYRERFGRAAFAAEDRTEGVSR